LLEPILIRVNPSGQLARLGAVHSCSALIGKLLAASGALPCDRLGRTCSLQPSVVHLAQTEPFVVAAAASDCAAKALILFVSHDVVPLEQ
jgi:hypothetical protein